MLTTACQTSRGEIPFKGLLPEQKRSLLNAEIRHVNARVDVTAPTTAQPGTIGKAAVLHGRAMQGLPLFHPDDAIERSR
ncbi:MAG: hypothetical protein RIK87_04075 [Fuerstiella sp.]